MNIQELLGEVIPKASIPSLQGQVKGLSLNTKTLKPHEIFFAIKGHAKDGRTYLQEAIEKGASALVIEALNCESFLADLEVPIPLIKISHLHQKLSHIAGRFYGDPSQTLKVIGVTGTNGKTTCAHLLSHALTHLGIPCGVIGTLTHTLTTPDAITLQAELAAFQKQTMKAVVMEVSSHGLDQHRVEGIHFESALFTNLTQDHLDYHKTMQAYGAAKQKLFYVASLKRRIVNAEDAFTQIILNHPSDIPTFGYTTQSSLSPEFENKMQGVVCLEKHVNKEGIILTVRTPFGQEMVHSKLIGHFNISNLLCVLTELCCQGIPLAKISQIVGLLEAPLGRMQQFKAPGGPLILIDYAHTPDALCKALKAARAHCAERLWCVFGCGGDRDKLKRPQMGYMAATLADTLVITNDNPRHEAGSAIMADILKGIPANDEYPIMIEEDREKAISYAIRSAGEQDVILIAGKGHESYQQIGDRYMAFSDIECVQSYLRTSCR